MSRRVGALMALALLLVGCAAAGSPSWQRLGSSSCRQQYGARGSTPAEGPGMLFFCAESP